MCSNANDLSDYESEGRGSQSSGLSARARESPFRRTKDEVLQKRRTSSFFVVFGKFRKGVEQPVRPPCVPAGADSPADCPQGRGRVPFGAPQQPYPNSVFWVRIIAFYTVFHLMIRQKAGADDFSFGSVRPGFLCARIACAAAVQTICDGNAVEMRTF